MGNKKLECISKSEEYYRNLYHYYDRSLFYETCDIDVATALLCSGLKVLFMKRDNPKIVTFVFENRLSTQKDYWSETTEIVDAYRSGKLEIKPRTFKDNLRILKKKLNIKDPKEIFQSSNCPACGESVVIRDMVNALSKKEFTISGLCQKCQDKTFK